MEIIERYSQFLTAPGFSVSGKKYNLEANTGIEYIDLTIDFYKRSGADLFIFDTTSELGVSTFTIDAIKEGCGTIPGYGSHLDPAIAISRALGEIDVFSQKDSTHNKSMVNENIFQLKNFTSYSTYNVKEDLRILESLLQNNDYDIIYIDCTRTEFNIPVVKTLIPNLQRYNVKNINFKPFYRHLHQTLF